ncbi:MAG: RNA polymerase sigma factor [Nocardioidaceae bacterium]
MPEPTFAEVLSAAREGDEHAFVVLFRSVQPLLLRLLSTTLGSAAEDVAADTWVSVVRNLDRFSGDESGWRGWVFTIAWARMRDEQRRSYRRPLPVDTEAALVGRPADTDVEAEVECLVTTEAALALIGRLPAYQAEVVLLRYVVGLDVDQTARIVGKRPGTVRVAAHRGLRSLEALLEARPGQRAGNAADVASDERVT